MAREISLFRKAIVYGTMIVFVVGIPSLPGKHLVYWISAVALELILCLLILPFRQKD